jgi:hypothetical protein
MKIKERLTPICGKPILKNGKTTKYGRIFSAKKSLKNQGTFSG